VEGGEGLKVRHSKPLRRGLVMDNVTETIEKDLIQIERDLVKVRTLLSLIKKEKEEAYAEGVLYALDYLSGLFEGVEDTDLASDYGFEKEEASA